MGYYETLVPACYEKRNNRFTRALGRAVLSLFGWRVTGAFPEVNKIVVSVAPHTSNWDFVIGVLALWALDVKITFFGKHTLFRGPFGAFMRSIGGIPVDRSQPHGIVGEIIEAFKHSDRMLFALAPEGTRQLDKGFRTGFLHIAHGAQVPICLASFDFENKAVHLGPMIQPSGDVDADLVRIQEYYRPIRGKYVKSWQAG